LPATKTTTLREQAKKFQERLAAVKSYTALDPRVTWYPWQSLGQMEVLDTFLKGDIGALMQLIGRDPVLDVGCGDGDIAFFLESLGAHIDAIDHAPTNYNALLGVHALKQKLDSSIRIHAVDMDARPNLPSSNYGLTVMLGVLYHLKNPFLVLEALAQASRYIFLSTRVASLSPDRKTNFGALPIAYLVEEDELNNDNSNFWIFSETALRRVVRRSGWDVMQYSTIGPATSADPVTAGGDARAFILAKSRAASPPCDFRLLRGWHQLEHKTWRWTERAFSLDVESYAPLQPATLRFVFQLPDVVFSQASVVTLSVRINGTPLVSGIYSAPGEHEYIGSIPALPAGVAIVDFELDRAIGPSDADRRELGLLVDFSGAAPVGLSQSSR
jgi:2-polyprenyl-3-methyl-5-hydroxy-6-metoxy-1,4-benzoquinol methylase